MQVKRFKFIANINEQIEEAAGLSAGRADGAAVVCELELNDDEWFSFLESQNLTEEDRELQRRGLLDAIQYRKSRVILRHARPQREGILGGGKSENKAEGTLKLKN